MKEVAEQLLQVMRTALEAKQAGKPGNYQGILNQVRGVFDSAVKSASASFPELRPMVMEAQRIQIEGARISGPVAKTTVQTGSPTGRQLDMKAAIEFKKKQEAEKGDVVVQQEKTAKPKTVAPSPEPEADEPAAKQVNVSDSELLNDLAAMSPKKLTEYFGSIEALAAFARELTAIEREEEETDSKFAARVKAALKEMANV